MNTKAFFPFGGGSNLIFGIGGENQIFFLRTPATVKFFTKLSNNDTAGVTGVLDIPMMSPIMGKHWTPHDSPHDGGCNLSL